MMINKKQTWSDNPFDQWTEEELLCMKNQGICYGKGGGGSPPPPPAVQTQVQQSEFPSELKPFISDIFGKAQAIQEQREEEGFQAFEGPLQAQFDPAQTRAFERIEQIPGATQPLFEEATTLAREATRSPTDPQEVASFMNPFLRNVTDIQKREAERVADVEEQNLAAQAAQAGAFGGSRAAVQQGIAGQGLQDKLAEIQAVGQQKAFEQAQQQFQRDREAQLAAERQGLSAAESLSGQSAQLAALGEKARAGDIEAAQLLEKIAKDRQAREQAGLDLAYEDFVRQRDFPREFPITKTIRAEAFDPNKNLFQRITFISTSAFSNGSFLGSCWWFIVL